jgi:hypothetical protein
VLHILNKREPKKKCKVKFQWNAIFLWIFGIYMLV